MAKLASPQNADAFSPKRRPKPSPMVPVENEVARDSGAVSGRGTFGRAGRFNQKVSKPGNHSPNGEYFYASNALFKNYLEKNDEKTPTLGFGERSPVTGAPTSAGPYVGPGSYDIIRSAAGGMLKSPTDGKEYCTITMKSRGKSSLTATDMCSPGPHAKYEVRLPLDHHLLKANKERLSHGGKSLPQDTDQPGPGQYDMKNDRTVASATRGKNTQGTENAVAGGSKKFLKSTFGMADRFGRSIQTCSPTKEMYYAHSKFWTEEDYLAGARTCTFGHANKTDLANPSKLGIRHRTQVSPVTYNPISSSAKPTSALDGFITRCASPTTMGSSMSKSSPNVKKGAKATMAAKCLPRSPSAPAVIGDGAPSGGKDKDGGDKAAAMDADCSAAGA